MQYVYMLRAGKGKYKIGVATNVRKRINGIQTSNAEKVELVSAILVPNANEVEAKLHQALQDLQSGGGTEWFELTPEKAIEVVILLNGYAVDISATLSEQIVLHNLLEANKSWKKSLEKKLDLIVNNYQRSQKKVTKEVGDEDVKMERLADTVTDDDLYEQAVKLSRERGLASTSMLQRRLKIGYGRAARIMDKMEDDGLISPMEGNHPRTFISDKEISHG